MLVRVRPEGVPETLAELREAWERLAPGVPFSYRFLEDHIAERFFHHARTISLLRWVTGFLVLIACLGVFGMASLAVSRRTKEVAVRKVLGASTANVAVLLSSQSTAARADRRGYRHAPDLPALGDVTPKRGGPALNWTCSATRPAA